MALSHYGCISATMGGWAHNKNVTASSQWDSFSESGAFQDVSPTNFMAYRFNYKKVPHGENFT